MKRFGLRGAACIYSHTARLWNATTGKQIAVLRGRNFGLLSAAFSPDGACIVATSEDQTARIWDGITDEEITVPRGHKHSAESAAFCPDGASSRRQLTTRCASGTPALAIELHSYIKYLVIADALMLPDLLTKSVI
jgi:WD40 repeat protein